MTTEPCGSASSQVAGGSGCARPRAPSSATGTHAAGRWPRGEDVQPGDSVGHAHMIAIPRGPTPPVRASTGRKPTRERDMDESYPLTYSVDYPDRELNRLSTFFRVFAVIPIAIVL